MNRIADIVVLFMALVFAAGVTQLYGWAGGLVGLLVLALVFVFLILNAEEGEDWYD